MSYPVWLEHLDVHLPNHDLLSNVNGLAQEEKIQG